MKDKRSGTMQASESVSQRKAGFYDSLFNAQELRRLEVHPQISAEQDLLRTLAWRLAKLMPLKELNDDELNALLKLVRLVAVIDALERTQVMRLKGGLDDDGVLASIAARDVEDL